MPGARFAAGTATLLMLCVVLTACGGSTAMAPVGREPRTSPTEYVVQRGDTLYYVAWRFAKDWSALASYNALTPPYAIQAGQRLRLEPPPRSAMPAPVQQAPRTPPAPSTDTTRETPASPAPAPAPAPAETVATPAPQPAPPRARSDLDDDVPVKQWSWPTRGRLLGSFGKSGGNGIDIAGSSGQAILAAAPGTVVYSGSGLIGYGKLIIIKHNKNFLSAYAHNEAILANEGDRVDIGQQIAQMGSSGTDRVKLHFEIRRDGKPVDPLRHLPD